MNHVLKNMAALDSRRSIAETSLSARSTTLHLGFVGLLLLMIVIAIDSQWSMRGVEEISRTMRRESRERDALLDQLRLEIYRSATVVRDHLLEPDAAQAQSQKEELALVHTHIEDMLQAYERKVPSSDTLAHELRADVESYWQSLAPALQWDAPSREQGRDYLNTVIIPRRTELVDLTKQVTALNEHNLDNAEEGIVAVQQSFHQRVTFISILALLLGAILAALIIRRVQRLEREAEQRYGEVEEARRELGRLSEQLVAAQEEERRHLSRELHDEVGQALSAMLVELGRLESAVQRDEQQRQRFSAVRQMAENTIGTVRNMALLLRPSMLDDLGLIPALKWQAREVARRTNLKIKIVADDISEDLADSFRTCMYRVVQEALNNCSKHSLATQVRVVVRQNHDSLSVSVEDNGIGFDPKQEKGMGLLGIEERVERLGGELSIQSRPQGGTVLSIHFPVQVKEPA